MRIKTRFFMLLALLSAFAVIAAACGNDDDDDGGTAAEDATEEATEAPAEEATEEMTEEASGDGGEVSGTVNISGSSTVEPISVRVAELFETVQPGVVVNVDGPGTGDGFQLFCDGETDISDASRPIADDEIAACEENGVAWVELQVGIDGIEVMTNENNDAVECLSFGDLYALIGPESTGFGSWADAQALADELGTTNTFPDASLDISGPGEESGTFDSFIEIALEDIAEERGQEPLTRPDYNANADDNLIIQGIQSSDTSLGWVGFAFAEGATGVKGIQIDGGDGTCISPTAETIADGTYPISRPLFIYVNTASAAENPAVAAYVDFYVTSEGLETAVADVGYVALTPDAAAETVSAWESR